MKKRRRAEFGQGFLDAAAGPQQQPAFVGDHDLRTLARREMLLHLFGEVVHIDHSLLDAGVGEPVEHMIDQRPARDLDQRFRGRIREGPHTSSESCGKDHGAAGSDACRCCAHGQTFTGGTLARYQAASEASAGWDSERCR